MKHLTSIILILSLLATACELVVDVNMPVPQQKLTINSFFAPDSTWKAYVLSSQHVLETKDFFDSVTNANVVIYQDGASVETLTHIGHGEYTSATGRPLPETGYEIRVDAPGYQSIKAVSSTPLPVKIEKLEAQISNRSDWETELTVKLNFHDRPGEKNYYEAKLIMKQTSKWIYEGDTISSTNIYSPWLESNDPVVSGEENYEGSAFLFKDVLFEGKEFTLQFNASFWGYDSNLEERTYYIYFRTVSEDYYLFHSTKNLQDYATGDPFAQPVTVYNNVDNGFGIFAGYSQDVREFKIE